MPAERKYYIPDDELRTAVLMRVPNTVLAIKYGCSESAIRSRIKGLDRPSNPTYDLPRGKGGDVVFDAKMGEQRFTDCPRAIRDRGSPERLPPVSFHAHSYTGCAASLACV